MHSAAAIYMSIEFYQAAPSKVNNNKLRCVRGRAYYSNKSCLLNDCVHTYVPVHTSVYVFICE